MRVLITIVALIGLGWLVQAQTTPPQCQMRLDWQVYAVQAGDTLGSIAEPMDTTAAELVSANCLESSVLYIGQLLRVPPQMPPTDAIAPADVSADTCAVHIIDEPQPIHADVFSWEVVGVLTDSAPLLTADSSGYWVQLTDESQGWVSLAGVELVGECADFARLPDVEPFALLPTVGNPAPYLIGDINCWATPLVPPFVPVRTDDTVIARLAAGYYLAVLVEGDEQLTVYLAPTLAATLARESVYLVGACAEPLPTATPTQVNPPLVATEAEIIRANNTPINIPPLNSAPIVTATATPLPANGNQPAPTAFPTGTRRPLTLTPYLDVTLTEIMPNFSPFSGNWSHTATVVRHDCGTLTSDTIDLTLAMAQDGSAVTLTYAGTGTSFTLYRSTRLDFSGAYNNVVVELSFTSTGSYTATETVTHQSGCIVQSQWQGTKR